MTYQPHQSEETALKPVGREPDAPPRYTHDCTDCIYMGRLWHLDLYFHPGDGAHPTDLTVVARFGSDGPDYESGIGSQSMGVYVAVQRAVERGYLPASALELYE